MKPIQRELCRWNHGRSFPIVRCKATRIHSKNGLDRPLPDTGSTFTGSNQFKGKELQMARRLP